MISIVVGICLIATGILGFTISWNDQTEIPISKTILFLVYLFSFLSLVFGLICIVRECTEDGIITKHIAKLHSSESVEEKKC